MSTDILKKTYEELKTKLDEFNGSYSIVKSFVDGEKELKDWKDYIGNITDKNELIDIIEYHLKFEYFYKEKVNDYIIDKLISINKKGEDIKSDEDFEKELSINIPEFFTNIARMISFVEKVLVKICNNNVGNIYDDTITKKEKLDVVFNSFKWLECDADSSSNLSFIDTQYLKYFLRVQCFRQLKDKGLLPSYQEDINKNVDYILEKIFYAGSYKVKLEILNTYKKSIRCFLNEVYAEYNDIIEKFEKEVNLYKRNENNDKKELLEISLRIESIASILTNYFCTYILVNDINAPHGKFNDSAFAYSELAKSNFFESDFSNSNLESAKMSDSNFTLCNIKTCNCTDSDFSKSNLNSTNLVGSSFENAYLVDSTLYNVKCREFLIDSIKPRFYELFLKSLIKDLEDDKQDNKIDAIKELDELKKDFDDYYEKVNEKKKVKNDIGEIVRTFNDELLKEIFSKDEFKKVNEDMDVAAKNADDNLSYKVIKKDLLNELIEKHKKYRKYYDLLLFSKDKKEDYDEPIELGHVIFKNADLSRVEASNIDLSFSEADGLTANNADMNSSKCYYVEMKNSSFNEANLSNSIFYQVDGMNSSFVGVNANNAILCRCNFKASTFKNALISNALIMDLHEGTYYENSNADKDYKYQDCNFSNIVANDTIFFGLNANKSHWKDSVLKNSIFFDNNLSRTYFDNSDLSYAILFGQVFHDASFEDTLFNDTKIEYCNFTGSNLSRATLIGSSINKAAFNNANLHNSIFSKVEITNSDFINTNLIGVNFASTKFDNVTFKDIDLINTIGLASATFKDCKFAKSCANITFKKDSDNSDDYHFMILNYGARGIKLFRTKDSDDPEYYGTYSSISYIESTI